MDFNQINQNFQAAMLLHGITPPQLIVGDGKLCRFHIEGDKRGSKNGYYLLFMNNIACGIYGTWKEGVTHKWCSKRREDMSHQEHKAYKQQVAEAKRQYAKDRVRAQTKAARLAKNIFCSCPFANASHPYLARKCIKKFYARQQGENLVLPIININDELSSLQYITPNGKKWFLPNGAITSHFIPIQHRLIKGRKILICEGFSTGGALAQAYPDACVIAAGNAGNLKPVALNIRQHLPEAELIICADDDQLNPNNPGVNKGQEAAIAANALFIKPQWPLDAPKHLTDFNDLFCWLSNQETAA